MTEKLETTRRNFLKATGALGIVGIAGCIGGGSPGTSSGSVSDEKKKDENSSQEHGEKHQNESQKGEGKHEKEHEEKNHKENHEGKNNEGEGKSHDEKHKKEDGHHDEENKGDSNHESNHKDENHDEGGSDHSDHDHKHETDHKIGEPVDEIEVELVSNDEGQHFLPHIVHINKGGKVTWKLNKGSHDTTAYHPDNDKQLRIPDDASPWASELMSKEGEKFEKTFETEGVYDYFCTPHESLGMVGRVVVGNPHLHDQNALKKPDDTIPDGAKKVLEGFNKKVKDKLGES